MKKDKLIINQGIEEEYSYLRYYYEFEDKKSIWAKESKKEGIKEGKKEGIKEGIKEGKKEGIKEGMYLVAKNAIKQGLANEVIIQLTGLSLEEIEQLRNEER